MENNNQNNKKPAQKSNFTRNIIIFMMLIVSVILVFWAFSGNQKGEYVSDTQYHTYLWDAKVERVEYGSKYIIFKTVDGENYWTYCRGYTELDFRNMTEEYNKYVEEQMKLDPSKKLVKVEEFSGSPTSFNVMSILYPILIMASLILLVIIVMRNIKGVNKSSMDFVKNRARVIPSKVKFDKVAGADEEKAELEEIIQFLKNPDKFTQIGARIPKGVLLVGPPGTGKTLLAKAVAGEANVPFFTISGSDFMELYVGVGASRVRDLFENAKRAKPCIIFIDEIDAVGRQRGTGLGGGNDEREQTLNQLLVQMDGFEQNEGIIVMAATNRADILDPALTRPGRFDRQIYISSPDVKGREEILRVHAEGKPFESDVDLKNTARVTTGFTGADLENLLNEAAILAARNNRTKISNEDINNAIVKVSIGPQKRSRVVSENDRKITAFHEAGHAIVEKSVKNSDAVHEVSIIQRGGAAGYTISRPENDFNHMTKQKLLDRITVLLAGRSAEEIFLDDITTGASSDINQATKIARNMVSKWGMSEEIGLINHGGEGSEVFLGRDYQSRASYSEKEASQIDNEIRKIIDKCYKLAKDIINSNKDKMQTMVDVLLEKETIYADEVDMIMGGSSAKEVVEYIDKKLKEKEAQRKRAIAREKKEQELKRKKAEAELRQATNYVEELLKRAEAAKLEQEQKAVEMKNVELTPEQEKEIENVVVQEIKEEKVEKEPEVKKTSKPKNVSQETKKKTSTPKTTKKPKTNDEKGSKQ